MNVTSGLPEGWSFETVEHGQQVTYEVRNEHRFLIMSSTWDRTDSPTRADTTALPLALRGDGPCLDCGTRDNIVWFTDSTFFNAVMGDDGGILCLPCFVIRAHAAGYLVTGWRVLPEWPWRSVDRNGPPIVRGL